MIEKIIILTMFVFGCYATFQDGMIFEKYALWIEKNFGEFWCKPMGCCIICFSFWMSAIMYTIIWRASFFEGFICATSTMGLSFILVHLFND